MPYLGDRAFSRTVRLSKNPEFINKVFHGKPTVEAENEVRLIDAFIHSLQLEKFGFKVDHTENGRPAYHPADLLKLFIYGYLNRIRSSRQLEKECKRNIEVMWLLKSLV